MDNKMKMTCAVCDTDITGLSIKFRGDKCICQNCADAVFLIRREYRRTKRGRVQFNPYAYDRAYEMIVQNGEEGTL